MIGITGGVGCGKSTVLNLIKENFNALIIMADDVAKDLMKKGKKGEKRGKRGKRIRKANEAKYE